MQFSLKALIVVVTVAGPLIAGTWKSAILRKQRATQEADWAARLVRARAVLAHHELQDEVHRILREQNRE